MTIEDMAMERAKAMAEEIQDFAFLLVSSLKTAYPQKKIFPKRDRLHRVRRQLKKAAKAEIVIGGATTALNLATMIAQPMPRVYPDPTAFKSGIAESTQIVRGEIIERRFRLPCDKKNNIGPNNSCNPNLGLPLL